MAPELNYCKQCGRRLAGDDEGKSVAQSIAESLGYVGSFGLVGFFVGTFMLKKADLETSAIVVISLFYLSALFGLCFMMLRQTSPFTRGRSNKSAASAPQADSQWSPGFSTSQLPPATANSQAPSVTEHTTRTLHEVERQ